MPDPVDVIESILPPEGTVAIPLRELATELLGKGSHRVHVAGARGSATIFLAAELLRKGATLALVTEDGDLAEKLRDELAFVVGDAALAEDIVVYPGHEGSPYSEIHPDRALAMGRVVALDRIARKKFRALVLPAQALVRKLVPPEAIQNAARMLRVDEDIERDAFVRELAEMGYVRVPVVEDPGTFAVRGALIDLWSVGEERPIRIELFGDTVAALSPFDPFEQRVIKERLSELRVLPLREVVLRPDTQAHARKAINALADSNDWPTMKSRELIEQVTSGRSFFGSEGWLPVYYDALVPLLDVIGDDIVVLVDGAEACVRAALSEVEQAKEEEAAKGKVPHLPASAFFAEPDDVATNLAKRRVATLTATNILGESGEGLAALAGGTTTARDLAARDQSDLVRALKEARGGTARDKLLLSLARRIEAWRGDGLSVVIVARAVAQRERLELLLRHLSLTATSTETPFSKGSTELRLVVGQLSRGVILPAEGLAVVTEEEIFGSRAERKKARSDRKTKRQGLEDLKSLHTGDLVVHADHGIGRYLGLHHKSIGGTRIDLLVVEYAGGDKLYLPVHRLEQVQKYSGGEASSSKLDRLGGSTFAKTKSRVRAEVRKMADELLRLYAERKAKEGHALQPIDDEYRTFEATFPFEETPDQARAIADVNHDLEEPRPMDRLVCGDVGFGKTEVAIRAAFRVAMAGKQVALLCPTTVLAQQHYRTLESRFRDYPIRIRAMSRFQTSKEQEETVRLLKDGQVDVVVGTHRLLSKDIFFKDLGLLVVDEEQRFGVVHKERIKQLRTSVDVLTLTATPIPRTLQMAVTGIRDLSLISTPPQDRRAIRTIVTRFDKDVIREALQRELSRGGQIFYVYNRIERLHEKAHTLREIFPEARIAVAHGQMTRGGTAKDSSQLEKTMVDFVEGRYDILVATAIIESGLDIPRANTMIVDRADLFGLAQLYQLRGRVGRSKERAYCYLVVPPEESFNEDARFRIEALERHTELGSGFQIASLDLELRGGGDLLGAEQSGSVASVGFDMFVSMLEDAVHELRGEDVVHEVDPELSFDVTALLPEDYVADVGLRLSLYKRLASAIDEGEVADLGEELEERFGPPPEDTKRLLRLMTVKTELRKMRALGCEASANLVTIHLREDTPLDAEKILELVKRRDSPYRLTPDMRLSRRFGKGREGLTNAERMLEELRVAWKTDG